MGPTWVLSAQDGPHVSPMNLAIRVHPQQISIISFLAMVRYGICGVISMYTLYSTFKIVKLYITPFD